MAPSHLTQSDLMGIYLLTSDLMSNCDKSDIVSCYCHVQMYTASATCLPGCSPQSLYGFTDCRHQQLAPSTQIAGDMDPPIPLHTIGTVVSYRRPISQIRDTFFVAHRMQNINGEYNYLLRFSRLPPRSNNEEIRILF